MGSFEDYILEAADRMDFLCRAAPRCPTCDTYQVQIIKTEAPAVWRCRICKYRWGFEPPPQC